MPIFCFRLAADNDVPTEALLDTLKNSGRVFVTPAHLDDNRLYIGVTINDNIDKRQISELFIVFNTTIILHQAPSFGGSFC